MRNGFLLLPVLLLLLSGMFLPERALAIEGYYLQVGGGGVFVEDTAIRGGNVDNDVSFNWGWSASTSFGYRYDNGLRTEIEAAYRNIDVNSISFASPGVGDVRVATVMANLLFDFDIMDDSQIVPYFGGGAGVAYTDFKNITPLGVSTNQTIDEVDIAPALQAIAGIDYAISPNSSIYADYRFMSVLSPEFTTSSEVEVSADYKSSTMFIGVRFALGGGGEDSAAIAAVQDVPPAPPAPISRTYLVFFDWDSYDLSKDAEAVLQAAAGDALAGNAVAVEVRGYADRSGSERYNLRLSQKRADAVRNYLHMQGINEEYITAQGLGESDPMITTADGVKDPRNRRAEVVYVIDMQQQ